MFGHKLVLSFIVLAFCDISMSLKDLYQLPTDHQLETDNDGGKAKDKILSGSLNHGLKSTPPYVHDILSVMERIRILEERFEVISLEDQKLRKEVSLLGKKVRNRCQHRGNKTPPKAAKVVGSNESPAILSKGETKNIRELINRNITEQKDLASDKDKHYFNRIRRGTPQVKPDLKPAFHAYLTRTYQHDQLAVGMTIIFDKVVTNVGSHYNAASGIFTAPVSGVYAFNNAIETAGNAYMSSTFVKNGSQADILGPLAQGSAGNGYGSNMIILRLQAGDQVWMRVFEHPSVAVLYGSPRVTFSGFLL